MSAPHECASCSAGNGEAVFLPQRRGQPRLYTDCAEEASRAPQGGPRSRSYVALPIGPPCGCVGRRYSSIWSISGCRRHELGDRSCPAGDDRSQSLRAVLGRTNHDYEVSRQARSGG
jgi:hypothetical protein